MSHNMFEQRSARRHTPGSQNHIILPLPKSMTTGHSSDNYSANSSASHPFSPTAPLTVQSTELGIRNTYHSLKPYSLSGLLEDRLTLDSTILLPCSTFEDVAEAGQKRLLECYPADQSGWVSATQGDRIREARRPYPSVPVPVGSHYPLLPTVQAASMTQTRYQGDYQGKPIRFIVDESWKDRSKRSYYDEKYEKSAKGLETRERQRWRKQQRKANSTVGTPREMESSINSKAALTVPSSNYPSSENAVPDTDQALPPFSDIFALVDPNRCALATQGGGNREAQPPRRRPGQPSIPVPVRSHYPLQSTFQATAPPETSDRCDYQVPSISDHSFRAEKKRRKALVDQKYQKSAKGRETRMRWKQKRQAMKARSNAGGEPGASQN